MTITFAIIAAAAIVGLLFVMLKNARLEETLRKRDADVAASKKECERIQKHYESEAQRIYAEANQVLADGRRRLDEQRTALQQETERLRQHYETEERCVREAAKQRLESAQRLVEQQRVTLGQELERIRQHYEAEAQKAQAEAQAALLAARQSTDSLRKYEALRDAEAEAQRLLSEAMTEATALRQEARALLEQSRNAAAEERAVAAEKVRDIHEQADARLNQAIRDAGRIIAEAEKRAEQIAGAAYAALREKEMLEQAAQAMRNVIEGYGDRYLVPTHSLLDDLAAEYGYDAAGQSLAAAREQSKRMVEQGEAAACDYVEASRRNTAIQFVIHAFNGSVDATLSRVKSDNYGVLEQRIRDCYSIVNRDGSAFRNARILPAYLDARLAELKWAVVVQQLAQQQREEQRALKERMRDEEKARQEYEKKMRVVAKEKEQAAKQEELKRAALAEAEARLAQAHAEDKARWEQQVQGLRSEVADANQKLADATTKELTIAQQTKKGHVYIISNIGSFGEGVYKIGQTRRLEKQDRIDELGDASVPFDFDIHAWIESENAPALEHRIQKQFLAMQVNKVNSRKEFFRVTLADIRRELDRLKQGEDFTITHWSETAAATQWRESQAIEQDPERRSKWLARENAETERQLRRDSLQISTASLAGLSSEAPST